MRWVYGLAILWLFAAGAVNAAAQDSKKPTTDAKSRPDRLNALLAEWERRSTFRTLAVDFRQRNYSNFWGDETLEGRIIFGEDGLGLVHVEKTNPGKPNRFSERILWDGHRFVVVRGESRQIFVIPSEGKPKRVGPAPDDQGFVGATFRELGLLAESLVYRDLPPLLFIMNQKILKRYYRLELLRETNELATIKLIPITVSGRRDEHAKIVFLELDKTRFLPKTMILANDRGKAERRMDFTRIVIGPKIDPTTFQFKPIKGWRVINVAGP